MDLLSGRRALKTLGLALAMAVAAPALASAVPITYLYRGFAEGSLGGVDFADASFEITAQADTDNIGPWPCCATLQITHSSASVGLSGFGTFSFTEPTHTWIAEGCCMGIGADLSFNYLTLFSPAITRSATA